MQYPVLAHITGVLIAVPAQIMTAVLSATMVGEKVLWDITKLLCAEVVIFHFVYILSELAVLQNQITVARELFGLVLDIQIRSF